MCMHHALHCVSVNLGSSMQTHLPILLRNHDLYPCHYSSAYLCPNFVRQVRSSEWLVGYCQRFKLESGVCSSELRRKLWHTCTGWPEIPCGDFMDCSATILCEITSDFRHGGVAIARCAAMIFCCDSIIFCCSAVIFCCDSVIFCCSALIFCPLALILCSCSTTCVCCSHAHDSSAASATSLLCPAISLCRLPMMSFSRSRPGNGCNAVSTTSCQ